MRGTDHLNFLNSYGCDVVAVNCSSLRVLKLIESPPLLTGRLLSRPSVQEALERWALSRNERRITAMSKEFDVVYLTKITSCDFVRALRSATDARLVLDIFDALWLNPEVRDDFSDLLKIVDAVTTDNPVTAGYIRQYTENCFVVPDVVPLDRFHTNRNRISDNLCDTVTLGWIGSRGTVHNLYVIWEALEELFPRFPQLRLRLVGTGRQPIALPPFCRVDFSARESYDEAQMIDEVSKMDVGLFPMQNTERSQYRGVLKACIYMSGGAAVVASPIGEIPDLIHDGTNGMLARTTDEWIRKLEQLVVDADLRKQLATAGLETVRCKIRRDDSRQQLRNVLLDSDRPGK